MAGNQKVRDDDARGAPKGSLGNVPHVRNEAAAEQITILAGFGLPHTHIAKAIDNAFKDQGYSVDTIQRHYREELDAGMEVAKAQLLLGAYDIAMGRNVPEGVSANRAYELKSRKIDFLLNVVHKVIPEQAQRHSGADGGPIEYRNLSDDEIQERIRAHEAARARQSEPKE